jgi:hypothetical protein
MRKSIIKATIEEVVYEFNVHEIRDALIEKWGMGKGSNATVMVDWTCGDTDIEFKLIVTYKKEAKEGVE